MLRSNIRLTLHRQIGAKLIFGSVQQLWISFSRNSLFIPLKKIPGRKGLVEQKQMHSLNHPSFMGSTIMMPQISVTHV